MKKICCIIGLTENYRKQRPFYEKNSIESFKKWHPDIDIIIMGDDDVEGELSIARITFAKKMFDRGYTKVIMLGADTITCARLDEFLEDDTTPFLATLDHKMLFHIDFEMKAFFMPKHGVFEWPQINSDVSCFNTKHVLDEMTRLVSEHPHWYEQTAMNYIYTNNQSLVRIVDFPYEFTRVCYNNRAKGGIGADCIKNGKMFFGFDGNQIGEFTPIKVWKPIDDKLYNQDGKHVKVFHFCYHDNDEDPKKWFNEDTIKFFKDHCNCVWELEIFKND